MNLTSQLTKHFRDFYFGGNWTDVNLKDSLAGISWQQATTKVNSLNTIAQLVFHMNYFVNATMRVLQGKPIDAHDKLSFDRPPVGSQEDWEKLVEKTWNDAENFASLVEQLPESKLWETFVEEKYGSYYKNIQGIIEHNHYHLGQIVLIKKIVTSTSNSG